MNNQRNNVIEFYRYLFMLVLLAWHGNYGFFQHGYLVVEFFFILSGYLLMNSYLKKPKTAAQYTIDRLKRCYFEYFVASFLTFLYFGILYNCLKHTMSLEVVLKYLPEIFLVQSVGIFNGGYNYPMWYFSVLIVGGYFLYFLISRCKSWATSFILPLLIVFSMVFLFNERDSIEDFAKYGPFYSPVIRGVAEMGIGIVLCAFAQSRYYKSIRESSIIYLSICIDCISIVALLLTFLCFLLPTAYDKYVLMTFPVIVLSAIQNRGFLYRLFNTSLWNRLGGITYEMFLIHATVGSIFNNLAEALGISHSIICFIAYAFVVTFLAFAFKAICLKLQQRYFYTNRD